MKILAFDTSFAACSAAVGSLGTFGGGAEILAARFEGMEQGHASRLMPMIKEVMKEARLGFAELDGLAITSGPGTFTGTRIAVAAARALSLATDLPVYGATSLAVMARKAAAGLAENGAGRDIAVAVDARRGQFYVQVFANGAPYDDPQLFDLAGAATKIAERSAVVVGSGAPSVVEAAQHLAKKIDLGPVDLLPDAADLLATQCELLNPPKPLYLRPADAKPQAKSPIARIST